MIISRTPLRLSFFGGGTDLRSYYRIRPGRVVSTGIQRYLYVVVREQEAFVDRRYRINWSQTEFCDEIDEIQNPIAREALRMFDVQRPVELTTFSDIPAGTGLGSSSAFSVGLINALHALHGDRVTKHTLATEAASLELDVLGREMGKQDHFASAYGSFSVFTFRDDETVTVEPVHSDREVVAELDRSLMLFYMGTQRDASAVLGAQSAVTADRVDVLTAMQDMVDPMVEILSGRGSVADVGPLLDESWRLKRSITALISNDGIDGAYQRAMDAGALGGKLVGAGGGGFLMFVVPPPQQADVASALGGMPWVRPGFDPSGSRITYYEPGRVA
ncbi:MAG: GHMP kinase [Actinomycetota bacterium]|nr:GHMP kinase [Actinomycetota bacterium]